MFKFMPLTALALGLFAPLQAADDLFEALKGGKPTVQLRLRYEQVDFEPNDEKAHALTLRTAVGYKTGTYRGFSGYVQLEDVTSIGAEEYSHAANNETRPLVQDPPDSGVNAAYVMYGAKNYSLTVGRQTIIYDNARMIGNVGWRMNDQTFDAARLKATFGKVVLDASYAWEHNSITWGDTNTQNIFVNVSGPVGPGKLTGYGYIKDIDSNNASDTSTYGARYVGKSALTGDVKLGYTFEYAMQSDDSDAADTYDEDYLLGELAFILPKVTFKLGYENLTSGEYNGVFKKFSAPYPTGHAFNGWSDRLLATPATGVQDTYLAVTGKIMGVKALAMYHQFDADEGPNDYGSETNLLLVYKAPYGVVYGAKAAFFSADDNSGLTDVDKLWAWTEYKF